MINLRGKHIIILVLIILGLVLPKIILGSNHPVKLKSDQISWLVNVSLHKLDPSYQPIEGQDYEIKSLKYFANSNWVVVRTESSNGTSDPQTIIFKRTNGQYHTAYGPSNYFEKDDLGNEVPADVVKYLGIK